jgi:dolichol-phosphate mannosyltransferase
VVVPTFNERENIPKLIQKVFALYPDIHMLVVDDRSPDGTAGIVRRLQNLYPNLMLLERAQDRGFGCSYREGFRQALTEPQCRAVVMMDSDFSHNPAVIRHLLAGLEDHDAVVGSRYTEGGSVKNWNLRRRILSRAANFYVYLVLRLPVRDATAGFLCMRREALEAIPYGNTVSEGYAFLVELKYLLKRFQQRIAEFPITFDERREGQSKMSAGKMWESLMLPWRMRLRRAEGEHAEIRGSEIGS